MGRREFRGASQPEVITDASLCVASQHGIVFFFWSRSGGLQAIHWANEGYHEQNIGTGGPVERIASLAFSSSGLLYGLGDAVTVLEPHSGAVLATIRTPNAFRAGLWENDLLPPVASPSSSATAASIGNRASAATATGSKGPQSLMEVLASQGAEAGLRAGTVTAEGARPVSRGADGKLPKASGQRASPAF
jgi:hypothetical protein